jgi:glycosyltransferase involved in cell wall biosynthesis
MNDKVINSKAYWNNRFSEDWELNNGNEQTAFFSNLALEHLPDWIINDIKEKKLSICDAGCAEGDGTEVLAQQFVNNYVIGIDFSETAIKLASEKYPNRNFKCDDLNMINQRYDIIFSSNVLEHFNDPFAIINKMINYINKYLILLLPFEEYERVKEHFYTFTHNSFPMKFQHFYLIYYKEIECNSNNYWPGKQVLVIYTDEDNSIIESVKVSSIIGNIKNLIKEKDEKLHYQIEQNSILKHMESELSNRSNQVDSIIKELNNQRKITEDLVQELCNQLNDKKEEVKNLRYNLIDVNKNKEEVINKLSIYHKKIENLESELEIVKIKNNESIQYIKEKELLIKQLESILSKEDAATLELKSELNRMEILKNTLNNQLHKIYMSDFWKWATRYYKLRDNTPYKYIHKSLHILRRYGLNYFINKISEKVNNNRKVTINKQILEVYKDEHNELLNKILEDNIDKQIVVFQPLVDWNIPLFQRPQHIAANLGKEGFLYFFCTGNQMYDNINGFEKIDKSVFITNRFDLIKSIKSPKIIHLYSTDLATQYFEIEKHLENGDTILYEYIDEIHEELSGKIPQHAIEKHINILKNEKCITVATADKLYREVLQYRSNNCELITNGVEYEHFNQKFTKQNIPHEIKHIVEKGKSIIGYFGALAKWFDYELVEKISVERPNYEIILIGWNYDDSVKAYKFDQLPNVSIIGPINYKELPKYAYWFNICTIPFRLNDITESTSPIKLFEYMALSKPIVTTNMPECRKYKSVLIGENHNDFIAKLDEAIELQKDIKYNEVLKKEALENTWRAKANNIKKLIAKQTSL